MSPSTQVVSSAAAIRKLWQKHGIKDSLRFLAYCLSLLPAPAIANAARGLERQLSNKAVEDKLARIWTKVSVLNGSVASVASIEDAIVEIAATVEAHAALQAEVCDFVLGLGSLQQEFLEVAQAGRR